MVYLVSGSWPPRQRWGWVPSHKIAFNSYQISVGYSYYFYANIITCVLQAGHLVDCKDFSYNDVYLSTLLACIVPSSATNVMSRSEDTREVLA